MDKNNNVSKTIVLPSMSAYSMLQSFFFDKVVCYKVRIELHSHYFETFANILFIKK